MNTISPAMPFDSTRFQMPTGTPTGLERADSDAHADLGATSQTDPSERKEKFEEFVGTTMFRQVLSTMRKTVNKSPYFDGGRAEEVFQGQLDEILVERLSDATADQIAGPMYELWELGRK